MHLNSYITILAAGAGGLAGPVGRAINRLGWSSPIGAISISHPVEFLNLLDRVHECI